MSCVRCECVCAVLVFPAGGAPVFYLQPPICQAIRNYPFCDASRAHEKYDPEFLAAEFQAAEFQSAEFQSAEFPTGNHSGLNCSLAVATLHYLDFMKPRCCKAFVK